MSAGIPKLEDILTAIFLIIPGFISFIIAKKVASVEKKFSDFETTVISIFLSVVNYVPFRLLSNLTTIDEIRQGILNNPLNLLQIIVITTAIGLALGGLFKLIFRRSQTAGTLWDRVINDAVKVNRRDKEELWIIVSTQSAEYLGQFAGFGQSIETEEREVLLKEPYLIKRDCNGKITTNERLSDEITYTLFTSQDIKNITIYKELYPERTFWKKLLSNKINPLRKFIENNAVVIITLTILGMSFFVIIYLLITLAK